jgi:predicted esterase
MPIPPTAAPTSIPTLSLDETSAKEFVVKDFDAVHSPVDGDANQYLILGNVPISKPAADLAPDLAVFLGRWEGYSYAPPVKKDEKAVLVIQEITARDGKLIGWGGTNLQYPTRLGEIHFRVVTGTAPSIEFQVIGPDGSQEIDTFTYDREKQLLRGSMSVPAHDFVYGPFELTRDRSFYVYKDYAQYLAGKRIYPKTYQNSELQHYGQGYLLYLPEGYEDQPEKTWPLIFFLHGYGDRGDNVLLLAKASPFMFVREKGPLPCIIAAPVLNAFEGYASFPDAYMDGALAEIQKDYRVDPKRIYVTGLSMGGEVTYRFAVHQPETFAAIAPLSAYVDSETYSMIGRIKDLPVWAIHGADDTVVPLAKAQQPVDALKEAGSHIRFTVLEGHDHDVWTDTYSDPAFYDWLLQHQRPE